MTDPAGGRSPSLPATNPASPGANPPVPGADPPVPGADPSVCGADPPVPGADPPVPGADPSVPGVDPVRRPELAVGAIAVDDGALLLIRRGRGPGLGRWSLPGGRVEWGETMAQALVREVLEETGIECIVGELVGWVERMADAHHFAIFDFVVTPMSLHDPVAGDDAEEARWVPLEDVESLDLVVGLGEFLADHGIIAPLV